MTNNGLLTLQSPYMVQETAQRLEQVLYDNDATVFAKVDHSKNATQANLELRSTIVFIFGAPHIGTLLMQDNQQIAIDLPSKILIWEDNKSHVLITRNQTSWLKNRHGLEESQASIALEEKIDKIVQKVIL